MSTMTTIETPPKRLVEILQRLVQAVVRKKEADDSVKSIFLEYVDVGHELGFENEALDIFLCRVFEPMVNGGSLGESTLRRYRAELREESSSQDRSASENEYNILLHRIETLKAPTDEQICDAANISIRPYSVWNFQHRDRRFGVEYPGNIPGQLVFNALFFFTQQNDLIVDPMAGGGVVGYVCKIMKRRYLMYDVRPLEIHPALEKIKSLDIGSGLPSECKNADLVFLDPPYFKKMARDYNDPGSISGLSKKGYLGVLGEAADDFRQKGIKRLALLMSDYLNYEKPKDSIFIWEYVNMFEKLGWKSIHHVHCGLSNEQVPPSQMDRLIEDRIMWGLSRSLVVFDIR